MLVNRAVVLVHQAGGKCDLCTGSGARFQVCTSSGAKLTFSLSELQQLKEDAFVQRVDGALSKKC